MIQREISIHSLRNYNSIITNLIKLLKVEGQDACICRTIHVLYNIYTYVYVLDAYI